MTIRLIYERKDTPGTHAMVFDKDVVLVGREVVAGDDAEAWVLPHVDVSRLQCRFSRSGEDVYVEGLSARNGTFVNGRRIEGVTRLRGGDQVRFGNCRIHVPGKPGDAVKGRSGELGGGDARRSPAPGIAVPAPASVIVPTAQVVAPSRAAPEAAPPPALGRGPANVPEAGDVPEDMSPVVARARRWDELGRPASHLLRDAEGLRRSQAWLRGGAGLGGDAVLVRTFVQASELSRTVGRRRMAALGLWALAVAGFGAGTASVLASGLDLGDGGGEVGSGRSSCTSEKRSEVDARTKAQPGESESAALRRLASAVKYADQENCLAETRAEAELRRRLAGQSGELLGGRRHDGRITSLASRADGARVISVGEDGRVRVWSREHQEAEEIGEGIEGTRALWSADQKWLVVGGTRGQVAIFDGESWPPREIARKTDHRRAIVALAIDRGSNVVAAGDEDGTLRIWSLLDRTSRGAISREGPIEALRFDGRGGRLFSLASGAVEEHRLDGSRIVKRRTLAVDGVSALAVSQDGRQLITGDLHGRLLLWEDDQRPKALRQPPFQRAIVAVEFAPQVNGALAVTQGRQLAFFDLRKRQRGGAEFQLHRFDELAEVPRQLVVAGDRAVTVGESGAPEVWALDERERQAAVLFRLDAAAGGAVLEVASEHALAFTGDSSGAVRAWHLGASGGRGAAILNDHRGEDVVAMDLSVDGSRLASVGPDGTVLLYHLQGERPGSSIPLRGSTGLDIREVAFSPDALWLAAVTREEVLLWNTADPLKEPMREPQEGASHVAWLDGEGGARLLTSGRASIVRWEVVEGQLRQPIELQADGFIDHLAAGGEFVAVTTWQDGKSRLRAWRGHDELEFKVPTERLQAVRALEFSSSGKSLALGYADGTVQYWSLRAGGEGFDLNPNSEWSGPEVKTLAFSSEHLVVGDTRGGLRVMQSGKAQPVDLARGELGSEVPVVGLGAGPETVVWARGQQLMLSRRGAGGWADEPVDLVGHRGAVSALLVHEDKIAVSAGGDGTLRIWPLSPELLVARAKPEF